MAETRLVIEGLDEIRARFSRFPNVYTTMVGEALRQSLNIVWDDVGRRGYPNKADDSTYIRTGTLGRTLGISEEGGKVGRPDIFEIRKRGGQFTEGTFGTNLDYAPYVIGDEETEQAWMHQDIWWTLGGVLEDKVKDIEKRFNVMAEKLAKWLDGKGL